MNHPIRFLLGGKQVIDGVDEAVTGMRVGISPEDTLYYDVILPQVTEPEK